MPRNSTAVEWYKHSLPISYINWTLSRRGTTLVTLSEYLFRSASVEKDKICGKLTIIVVVNSHLIMHFPQHYEDCYLYQKNLYN